MSPSNANSATIQFAGLLAESISTYSGLSEQNQYSPELLQEFTDLLEAGADPNVVLFAYPSDDDVIIYSLDPVERLGETYVCNALRRQYPHGFKCAPHNIPNKSVHQTGCEVPLAVAAKRKDGKMLALLAKYGATYRVIDQLPLARRFNLRNPFQLLLHESDEGLLRQLLATTEPNIPIVKGWLELCIFYVLDDFRGDDDSRLRVASLLAHRGGVLPPSDHVVLFKATDFLMKHNIIRDEHGFTVLHCVAGRGASELCKWFLSKWLDPNATDVIGISSLHEAVLSDDPNTVRVLLQYGANPNLTCGNNQLEKAELCMTEYSELAGALYYRTHDSATLMSTKHWSALHVAAYRGDQIIVQMLLEGGAEAAVQDHDGNTALQIALQYENIHAAVILFNSYCPLDVESQSARHLILLAIKHRSSAVVQHLVKRGTPAPTFFDPDTEDWFHMVSKGIVKEYRLPEADVSHTTDARNDGPAAAFSICRKCLRALEGKVIALSSEVPSTLCKLCRLVYDSAQHRSGTITHLEYANEAGSPDLLLETRTASVVELHPIRVVSSTYIYF
jgi:ankyrin repeat protein